MKRKGFTLIELLVVIAIIGLLSTLAVTALGGARKKARDARRLSDVKQIQTSLELYYSDNSSYPDDSGLTSNRLGTGNGACLNSSGFSAAGCSDPYMNKIPVDPVNTTDTWYLYTEATNLTSYHISYTTEATSEIGAKGYYHAVPGDIGVKQ